MKKEDIDVICYGYDNKTVSERFSLIDMNSINLDGLRQVFGTDKFVVIPIVYDAKIFKEIKSRKIAYKEIPPEIPTKDTSKHPPVKKFDIQTDKELKEHIVKIHREKALLMKRGAAIKSAITRSKNKRIEDMKKALEDMSIAEKYWY